MNKNLLITFWILTTISITFSAGLIYAVIQQDIRQSANDPQIEIAEDAARELDNGKTAKEFDIKEKIDIAKSLATFTIVYDKEGKPLASSGALASTVPSLPQGVFDVTKAKGQDRVTWQPRSDVRSALVVVPYKEGFVAVGRSLREVEARENNLLIIAMIFWVTGVLVISGLSYLISKKWSTPVSF